MQGLRYYLRVLQINKIISISVDGKDEYCGMGNLVQKNGSVPAEVRGGIRSIIYSLAKTLSSKGVRYGKPLPHCSPLRLCVSA